MRIVNMYNRSIESTLWVVWNIMCVFELIILKWPAKYSANQQLAKLPCFTFNHEIVTTEIVQFQRVYRWIRILGLQKFTQWQKTPTANGFKCKMMLHFLYHFRNCAKHSWLLKSIDNGMKTLFVVCDLIRLVSSESNIDFSV